MEYRLKEPIGEYNNVKWKRHPYVECLENGVIVDLLFFVDKEELNKFKNKLIRKEKLKKIYERRN